MRVLLSTIGSRGDVQPLVALATELRGLGQEVRLCVPPDFREWIQGMGFEVVPIGPELRRMTVAQPAAGSAPPSPEVRRRMAEGTVAAQFETIGRAAEGCDLLVGATALQIAAPSVAEALGIPYVFVAYCPVVLPSPRHAPPLLRMLGQTSATSGVDNRELWEQDARRSNELWKEVLNSHRVAAGLPPVADVRGHIFTDRPWLAADPTLAPWPDPDDLGVVQTGAWILRDERPLSTDLEAFLDEGEPPIYFGFGSMHALPELGAAMVDAARALGRRAIINRGWAELTVPEGASDCLVIGEVNQQALFGRVAAVVHHGGAGTTTIAALAGVPQVVVPQMYDQYYWAERVEQLGVGTASSSPTRESLTAAIERTLRPEYGVRARSVASGVRTDGARIAADRLVGGADGSRDAPFVRAPFQSIRSAR